jgi:hypothetical protein
MKTRLLISNSKPFASNIPQASQGQDVVQFRLARALVIIHSFKAVRSAVLPVLRGAIRHMNKARAVEPPQARSQADHFVIGMRKDQHGARHGKGRAFLCRRLRQ